MRMLRLIDKGYIRNIRYSIRNTSIGNRYIHRMGLRLPHFHTRLSSFFTNLCLFHQFEQALIVNIESVTIDMN